MIYRPGFDIMHHLCLNVMVVWTILLMAWPEFVDPAEQRQRRLWSEADEYKYAEWWPPMYTGHFNPDGTSENVRQPLKFDNRSGDDNIWYWRYGNHPDWWERWHLPTVY